MSAIFFIETSTEVAMKIRELYPEVITENKNYEYKATLNPENGGPELGKRATGKNAI